MSFVAHHNQPARVWPMMCPKTRHDEYFCQEKAENARESRSTAGLRPALRPSRDFSLDGHRLSSLFRSSEHDPLRLILGKRPDFFLAKILKTEAGRANYVSRGDAR
ncbi:hypothetical protein [uncultured Celeribacter sp.]|uniref:hypothetical protein n=1 Tax=uncultured Celeribacter sp. TaxID=1303376 RepID=UPI002AA5EB28|nr:hypothetical protein [uncultured Celeribacter sp.]